MERPPKFTRHLRPDHVALIRILAPRFPKAAATEIVGENKDYSIGGVLLHTEPGEAVFSFDSHPAAQALLAEADWQINETRRQSDHQYNQGRQRRY